MTYEEILTLCKAGFTAQQISAIAAANQANPASAPQVVPAQPEPAPAPAPAAVSGTVPAPVTVPALVPVVTEPAPAPVPSPAPVQPTGMDAVLAQMAALTQAVQANAIKNTAQPQNQEMTIDDVMASVIDPTYKPNK